MHSEAYEKVKRAIRERKQVVATCNGCRREMCPHAIGTKAGREKALFYQFGGESNSDPIVPASTENWRCMFVSDLGSIDVRGGDWHTAPNHSIPQTCVDFVDLDSTM